MAGRYDIGNGFTVYGADNRKIGTVKNCTSNYCHMDTGFLGLGPDYYFPVNAVRDVVGTDVYLDVASDQLGHMGWDHEPTQGTEYTTGSTMGGTMPRTGENLTGRYDTGIERGPTYGERETTRGEREAPYGEQTRSMPLREEELTAQKSREQVGEVELGKHVIEEKQEFRVPVTHEEVYIKERPVDKPSDRPIGEGETIRVPVTEEHVNVEKQAHIYGEVDVEKRRVTEQQVFSETVRKEVPDIHETGKAREFVKGNLEETNLSDKDRLERERLNKERLNKERLDKDNPDFPNR